MAKVAQQSTPQSAPPVPQAGTYLINPGSVFQTYNPQTGQTTYGPAPAGWAEGAANSNAAANVVTPAGTPAGAAVYQGSQYGYAPSSPISNFTERKSGDQVITSSDYVQGGGKAALGAYQTSTTSENTQNKSAVLSAQNYRPGLTPEQITGIEKLLQSERPFSATDAKNYAYATGKSNWQEFVGKTGSQLTAQGAANSAPAPASGAVHSVVKGDSLGAIAKKYGVNLADLLQANPQITNPNLIFPGDQINIPTLNSANDLEAQINNTQKETKGVLDKANEKDSTGRKSAGLDEEEYKPDVTTNFKKFSALEKYNEFFGDNSAIKGLKDKVISVDKQLTDLQNLEDNFVKDIRKEVSGEAPESYIQALASERASDLYPRKAALLSEKKMLEAQLANEEETAKMKLTLSLQDEENTMNRLKMYAEAGIALDAESFAAADKALGASGVAKQYYAAIKAEKKAKTDEDKLDLMTKIINIQKDLPLGKTFTFGGATYESLSDPTENIQYFSETNAAGEKVIIAYDKTTKQVTVTKTGVFGKVGEAGETAEDKEFKAFNKDASDAIVNLDTGKWGWATAFDFMKRMHPTFTDDAINGALGGGIAYDSKSGTYGDAWGRGKIEIPK
jgi:spore coat assembly protein SafA